MLIVADTSALLALATCASLDLLDELFGEVWVPAAVYDECAVSGKPEAGRLAEYLAGRIVAIDLSEFVISTAGLGRGELEAMALYKHLHADRLLIDDGRARRVARLNGIEIIGSLGVLLFAKDEGRIGAIRPRVERIRAAGIRLADDLVSEVLRLSGE